MKKYFVIKIYNNSVNSSYVQFTSDSEQDAIEFAYLMNRNKTDERDNYIVGSVIELKDNKNELYGND